MSDPTKYDCNYACRLLYPFFFHYRVGSRRLLRSRESLLVRDLHLWKSIELLDVRINGRVLVKRLEC